MEIYEKLKKALELANKNAQRFATIDDGGTCNFDSPVLDYQAHHLKADKVLDLLKSLNLRGYKEKWCGKTVIIICGCTSGQGNRRTAMAEEFTATLKNLGWFATMYYQMD